MVLSNRSMVFGSSPRHIIAMPFFLPTSKKLIWSLGRKKCEGILAFAYFVKSNNGSKEKDVIQSNQDVHVCETLGGYIVWLT